MRTAVLPRSCTSLVLALTLSACTGDDGDDGGSGDNSSQGSEAGDGDGDGDSDTGGQSCESDPHAGEATYYDFADGSGNCSFPATPDDLMVGAMNHTDYAGSAVCGSCVRIQGPDGSVDVRIVDRCPECPAGDIDLSPDAFSMIAPLEDGRVPIEWEYISCPVQGPIVYHFKDGSNQWWTAVQIRNHRNAIAKFEYHDGNGWIDVPRLEYNYFVEEAGMGEGPYRFRVTDVLGGVLEDDGIPSLDDADAPGSGQFDACE